MKKIVSAVTFFICALTVHAQDNVNREAKVPLTQWAVNSNYSKSDKGRLIINLPVEVAAMVCLVNKSGDAKTFALHLNNPKELLPGSYDITFWGIKIPSVTVEKAKDTRILAGVLNSTVKGLWEIWTTDGLKIFSSSGPKQIALPIGNYIIKTHGAEIKTAISDGKVSIFSYTGY